MQTKYRSEWLVGHAELMSRGLWRGGGIAPGTSLELAFLIGQLDL